MTIPSFTIHDDIWKSELEKSVRKYHVAAAWIGIVFDPVFAVTDYYNLPGHWEHLLLIRLTIALITLIGLVVRKHWNLSYTKTLEPVIQCDCHYSLFSHLTAECLHLQVYL
jgi:hypothetical protein